MPSDFHVALGSLTHRGLRVIAVGHRTIQAAFHKTDKIERWAFNGRRGGGKRSCNSTQLNEVFGAYHKAVDKNTE